MSYVQGTRVRVQTTVTDVDTGAIADPTALTLRVQDPSGFVTEQTLNTGLMRVGLGVYRGVIDTTPARGVWKYQFISDPDTSTETVEKSEFNVRAAVPAPI